MDTKPLSSVPLTLNVVCQCNAHFSILERVKYHGGFARVTGYNSDKVKVITYNKNGEYINEWVNNWEVEKI